jgi:hypothetical protein
MRRYERVDRDGDRAAQVRGENNRLRGDMHRREITWVKRRPRGEKEKQMRDEREKGVVWPTVEIRDIMYMGKGG